MNEIRLERIQSLPRVADQSLGYEVVLAKRNPETRHLDESPSVLQRWLAHRRREDTYLVAEGLEMTHQAIQRERHTIYDVVIRPRKESNTSSASGSVKSRQGFYVSGDGFHFICARYPERRECGGVRKYDIESQNVDGHDPVRSRG